MQDYQTQLYKLYIHSCTSYMCTTVPSSSTYWFSVTSQCSTILKVTDLGSVTIPAHNIFRSTCYRSCVKDSFISFLDYNFSVLSGFKTILLSGERKKDKLNEERKYAVSFYYHYTIYSKYTVPSFFVFLLQTVDYFICF